MTVNLSSNYQVYQKPGYTQKWTRSSAVQTAQVTKTESVSQYGNTCTDGVDDGKISLWDKITGVFKGAVRSVGNMVKGIFSNPLKSAAIIGVCCIPVVGKFIGLGLAAYGLLKSGAQLINNISEASQSVTDASARDAWENIGTSGLNTVMSAVAMKGCASGIKADLHGGSATVNLARDLKSQGVSKADLYSQVAKEAVSETGSNIAAIPKAIGNKVKSAYNKAREFYSTNKGETIGQTASNMFKSAKTAAKNKFNSAKETVMAKVDKTAKKIGEKADKLEAKRNMTSEQKTAAKEAAKSQKQTAKAEQEAATAKEQAAREAAKAEVEAQQNAAIARGAKVHKRLNGEFSVQDKNSTMYFDAYGKLKSTTIKTASGTKTWDCATKEYTITDYVKDFDKNVEFNFGLGGHSFGKLTMPVTYREAADLTPYVVIGENEQN